MFTLHCVSIIWLFLGASSSHLFAMFDDMDWDMEAAADQEEDFLSFPPADEDEHCFGVPPADPLETASVEDPREHIACCDAEQEEPSEVQKEPEPEPVHLPIAADAPVPEISKFRRLNTKTTPATDWPVRVSPSPAAPPKAAVPEAAGEEIRWWTALDVDQREKHVEAMVRQDGWKRYQEHLLKQHGQVSLPVYFSKLNRMDKRSCVAWWVQNEGRDQTPFFIREWVNDVYLPGIKRQRKDDVRRYQGKQFLFTCNGDWGLVQVPKDVSLSPVLSEAIEQLKNLDTVTALWLKVREAALGLRVRLGADDVAVCLELCPKTYKDSGVVRLHAHVALACHTKMRFRLSEAQQTFLGGKYKLQTDEVMGKQRKIGWQTFYYTSCPKISQLWSYATKEPFADYLVNANWIWNHLQSGKISVESARHELVRTCGRLTQHLPNLDRLRSELIARELSGTIAEREAAFAAQRRPYKKIKPVQDLVDDLATPRERRKFLVLDGPSRMGKTQYAMSLFGRESSLEVNAAGEDQPSLQHFDFKRHKMILLDEASPEMVLKNRKVFQAPNAVLELGQSKTNCHSYQVYLNNVLFVIASNGWVDEVGALPPSSRKWIEANQVLINVTRPLWVDTPAST